MIAPTHIAASGDEADRLVFHQDPVEELLKIFDVAFRLVVPGPGRQVVGLKSISEKQNGAPGWYLWFEDCPGAYLLELADAGTRSETAGKPAVTREAVQGSFRIKYYPDLSDPSSLSLFSASEQLFRRSDCFDETGTPDFERGGEIPDSFFQMATIEAALSADGRGFVLRLDAPERWVTWAVEGVSATDEQGNLHHLRAPGEKDRDIPAWKWSWFLMDRLVQTLCLAHFSEPWHVALYEAPGHAFRVFPSGVSQAIPDGAIRRRLLSIAIRFHDGHAHCIGAFPSLSEDPSLLLTVPPGEQRVSLRKEPSGLLPWVSSAWWHVRESPLDFGGVPPC